MLLVKLKYHIHLNIAVYYYHKLEKTIYGSIKWQKYDDKFWKHIDIVNELREKYSF